jgi:ribonucleotide reductase beta subunit family protein with ferritin-like domain/glutaredoxin
MYPWAVDLAIIHEKVHWVEQQVSLTDDALEWKNGKLSHAEKNFITQILRLFTQSDVNVGQFYYEVLIPRIKNNEVRVAFGSFANREGTHQRAYAFLNDTLGFPESDYRAFLDYEEMTNKHEFMFAADSSTDEGFLFCLAKAVFNEGVTLFASFAMLLNFQRFGKMKGMGKIVEWSQRDETLHVIGLSTLFRSLAEEMPELVTEHLKRRIYEMATETVELEHKFIDLAFELGGIEDLTPQLMQSYVEYVANRRLTQLGLKEIWAVDENPLVWIDWLMGGADHTNFFENNSTQYEDGGPTGEWIYPTNVPEITGWIIYSKPDCPYCEEAYKIFANTQSLLEVKEIADDDERAAFYNHHGFTSKAGPYGATMPKIYEVVNGIEILVGGLTELKEKLELTHVAE